MKTYYVLTVVGQDRPGIVRALAQAVADAGGEWFESRMATLADRFAGVVRVAIPSAQHATLMQRLRALEAEGLRVTVEPSAGQAAPAAGRLLNLELLGQDRPGIVRDIAALLARHEVLVEELDTGTFSAQFSGETMFRARARLRVPDAVTSADLRDRLHALANELMVDVNVDDGGSGGEEG